VIAESYDLRAKTRVDEEKTVGEAQTVDVERQIG
jgi:hypothetical protein